MNSLPLLLAQKPSGKKPVPQICQNDQIIKQLETELKASRNALKTEKARNKASRQKLLNDVGKICNDHIDRMYEIQEKLIEKLKTDIGQTVVNSTNQSSLGNEQDRKNVNKAMFPCEICLQPYSSELRSSPRVLLCGHTLCFSCAERLVDGTGIIKCPFDRKPTKIGHVDIDRGLPRNYALLNMCV